MKTEKILLDHGSGGKLSHQLISDLILKYFNSPILTELDDCAVVKIYGEKLAFSTDSYTVDPIFFPGGNIGELAIFGTVNDLAMRGAKPHYLSVGFIIEEGFSFSDLEKILLSMQNAAREANIEIITGDTKVVPKGTADKIFINTSGIGIVPEGIKIAGKNARPGDKILINGFMAEHGLAILLGREGLNFTTKIKSDTAPLNHLVAEMLAVSTEIHTMRDPTRGGVGTTLNEIARQAGVGIVIEENRLPIREEVKGACELLGFDPLYLANEGKLLAFVSAPLADKILEVMRKNKYGANSCLIGEVVTQHPGSVIMQTAIGGTRIVEMLTGAQLPRIC
ncbi:hydrogenase expression/formation protein HypE [candidate division KSB1 bacterium]|nr:hydrogenase expression/formation protein HypE [candidate division KSB1 bacterium]